MLYLYAARNFSALVGLAGAEPMANMYDTTYFRATWVLTAMDAGFWTAMRIRTKWLRDIASVVFSIFYLFATERADEKVRKVRGMITVDHMRVSWNKGTTPYLHFLQKIQRPRFTRWPPRQVRIRRPINSDYKEPITAWLYYDGPLADLAHHSKVILDIPGGGFVAMDPRCNDDKLFAWAAKTALPIVSLDYRKAPEFPYPYALNECFDVYSTLISTRGRCIGFSGQKIPRIILTGDSAGGNLAVATALMILETATPQFRRSLGATELPPPDGLVCFYPALDMNIGNWMSDEQMALIRDRKMRKTNRSIVRRKSRQYNDLVGTPHHSDDEDEPTPSPRLGTSQSMKENPTNQVNGNSNPSPVTSPAAQGLKTNGKGKESMSHRVEPLQTRLATSSMISYFNDRVLTPEMMRAMIILYIGPHNRPNFSTEYLLSPVLAPEALLAKFPKTYFMTGERDPLVDDTVVFAGRVRGAKEAAAQDMRRLGANGRSEHKDDNTEDLDLAEVLLIPGISHGFMQFPGIYPPAWKHFDRSANWFGHLFSLADERRSRRYQRRAAPPKMQNPMQNNDDRRRRFSQTESSGDEERPLEMTMSRTGRGRSSTQGNEFKPWSGAIVGTPKSPTLDGEDGDKGTKRGKKGMSKNKSLVKLSSSDDLVGRRMKGLASGLTGTGEDD